MATKSTRSQGWSRCDGPYLRATSCRTILYRVLLWPKAIQQLSKKWFRLLPQSSRYLSCTNIDIGEAVFGINVELFSQKSRGFVELRNSDPLSMPLIDHAFLSDPLDALVLTEAVRLANDVGNFFVTQSYFSLMTRADRRYRRGYSRTS